MDLGRLNMEHLKKSADSLLTKLTDIPDETNKGIIRFQLFKECRISQDENDEWFVEIDAHDRALPLMFGLKSHYFKYELWNTLSLKSQNQLRMYEILKQNEKIKHRAITIEKLRELLGIEANEYSRYGDFKRKVLDACQRALSEKTDISFTYEPHGKKGPGGKILELKFSVFKNENYQNPINLEKFIDVVSKEVIEAGYTKSGEKIDMKAIDASKIAPTQTGINFTEDEHLRNFELFWQAYPESKRAGKKAAMVEWNKLSRNQSVFNEIMKGLESAKTSVKWTNDGGKYAHEPTGWLKGEHWLDSYIQVVDLPKEKSKFQNYKGRNKGLDYKKMEQIERELLDKKIAEM